MSHLRRLVLWVAILFALVCLPPSMMAQTNYENYTFTTLAGPPESLGWYDGTNSAARFSKPYGVAVDGSSNVFVADTYNHTIRKITPAGTVMTLAGLAGDSGSADGTGYEARFYLPMGVTVDTNGNVYVTDTGNSTIRKVTPTGTVTTLAGSSTAFGTNDGIAAAARFNSPAGIAIGTNGVLYVADWYNHTIRKVTTDGVVTTLVGNPTIVDAYTNVIGGYANGTNNGARFNYPFGLTVGTNGVLYVADTYNYRIRKITPFGTNWAVSTLAGTNSTGSADGSGSVARFNIPYGVTADTNGNVYVADTFNQTLRKIVAGNVTTLAGAAGISGCADGTNTAARFHQLDGLAVDRAGNIFVADYANHSIRKVTSVGVVTTYAGRGGRGAVDGTGSVARFNYPSGVAVYGGTNVYVADYANHVIRKIIPTGEVTTLAGLAGSSGTNNGTGSAARFTNPTGVAVDTNGNVYVADTYNHTIRKITPAGSVTNLAGSGSTNFGSANGIGSAARFNAPAGVAVGTNGNVYVADTWNHMIRMITPSGQVTTVAGSTNAGSADGPVISARFYYPFGVAADNVGNLYVADRYNNTIRKIADGFVTTLAGNATILDEYGYPEGGYADGTNSTARFNLPVGVAVDSAGNVYVGDTGNSSSGIGNHTIRKITPVGVVTTLAGTPGLSGATDGTGATALFDAPEGLAVAQDGTVYVADTYNHTIRKGYAPLPDVPVVDLPLEKPGVVRHLDVNNLTTTSWSWSIVRYPVNALAQLSSATNRNPTFTPDQADLYVIRFQGMNSLERVAIGMLELVGIGTIEPQISNIQMFGPNVVLTGSRGAPGAAYSVLASSSLSLPMGAWTVLPGNKFDNNGGFTFTNGVSGSQRVFRLRVP